MKNVFIAKYLSWQQKSGQTFQNFDSSSPNAICVECIEYNFQVEYNNVLALKYYFFNL